MEAKDATSLFRTARTSLSGSLLPSTTQQEKPALVLQIGSQVTALGVGGEDLPRAIVPSTATLDGTTYHIYEANTISDPAIYTDVVIEFLFHAFFEHIMLKPHDRRIVLVEERIMPTQLKETLARALFLHYNVLSVRFVMLEDAVQYAHGLQTALIVDVGMADSRVYPVFANTLVLRAMCTGLNGTLSFHTHVRELLSQHATVASKDPVSSVSDFVADLPDDVIEDIAVRGCFACGPSEGRAADASLRVGRTARISFGHEIRVESSHVLFEDGPLGDGIVRGLLTALERCPYDTRKALASNIVVCGGSAHLPGFKHALLTRVRAMCEAEYPALFGQQSTVHVLRITLQGQDVRVDETLLKSSIEKIRTELSLLLPSDCFADDLELSMTQDGLIAGELRSSVSIDASKLQNQFISGKVSFKITDAECTPLTQSNGLASAFAVHPSPVPPSLVAWVGAAVFAALPGLPRSSLSADTYRQKRTVPDWTSLLPQEAMQEQQPTMTSFSQLSSTSQLSSQLTIKTRLQTATLSS